ncbi:hypothetical protein VIN30_00030 [Adlercreutzia sp. R7]|uniref:HTH deoR-type domain-containing protein n=1 Tax=Adlercreutzia wanghongyangiae TaxID=3111451 RepID=A0ABU6IEP4_9ACTN|nr:hypothetical protein [Adlercreutzia sp. R7]
MAEDDARFLEIVFSPEFEALWQAIVDEPITYGEFCAMDMPAGISPSKLWDAFSLLKRCMGESNEIRPWFVNVGKDLCWSYTPKSIEKDLFDLSSLLAPRSYLNLHVSAKGFFNPVIAENVIEEMGSVARRDGIPLTDEVIRELWLGHRKPRSKYELIVQNARSLLAKVPTLAKKNYSMLLADDINAALVHGAEDVRPIRSLHFDTQYYDIDRVNDANFVENSYRSCLAMANRATEPRDVIFASIVMADALWDLSPWPSCNALTEYLMRIVLGERSGIPALACIPLSSKDSAGTDGFSELHVKEANNTHDQGLDSTWLYAGQVKILLAGARDLLGRLEGAENEEARVRVKIEETPWLNFRQKGLLIALRKSPQSYALIKDYAEANKVAYATARQDLLELEEHGLLIKEKMERTFVYRLSPRTHW